MATKRSTRPGGNGGSRYGILLLLLLLVVVTLVVLMSRLEHGGKEQATAPQPSRPDSTPLPPSRSVVLFFGKEDADGLFQEMREIRAHEGIEEGVRAVVEELIRGPSAGGVPSIPKQASLNKVFFDERSGVLYLDFSKQLQTEHWGGSEGELLTIRSILQTIATNFPGVKAVQLLVDGHEVESIAGHVDTSEPFDLGEWVSSDRQGAGGRVFEESSP